MQREVDTVYKSTQDENVDDNVASGHGVLTGKVDKFHYRGDMLDKDRS